MENMTALVSTFARAYHYRNNKTWVFADSLAEKILTEEEYFALSLIVNLHHPYWPEVSFVTEQFIMT